MSSEKKPAFLIIIAVVALIVLGAGGFLAFKAMDQTAQNAKELEQFGYEMVASSKSFETTGELGTKQLPPTFDESNLPPTQKVIRGLMGDKEALMMENGTLREEIELLKAEIAQLEQYKQMNERFAPARLEDELNEVERQVKAFLIRNPDADRFTTLQIETMAAAASAEYKDYITRNRLMLSEDRKQALIANHLPSYAFCVGDGIEVAANSPQEARQLAIYFRTDDPSGLSTALMQDLTTVITPCQQSFRSQMDQIDRQTAG
jgi:hypothetical protein